MYPFETKASTVFPGIDWTGRSHMHVSRAWGICLDSKYRHVVLNLIHKWKVVPKTWEWAVVKFSGVEWYVTSEEFRKLAFAEYQSHLHHGKGLMGPNQIINPATGNRFHFIGVHGDYMIGVRWWIEKVTGGLVIGHRFRVVRMTEEPAKVRGRTRAEVEGLEVSEAMKEVETMLEFSEPPETPEYDECILLKELEV